MYNEIVENIFIGDKEDAAKMLKFPENTDELVFVINVREEYKIKGAINISIIKKKLFGDYIIDWNAVMRITRKMEKIRMEHPHSLILVACGMGMERSVLIVQYYLMRYMNMGSDDAFNLIKSKRVGAIRHDLDSIFEGKVK